MYIKNALELTRARGMGLFSRYKSENPSVTQIVAAQCKDKFHPIPWAACLPSTHSHFPPLWNGPTRAELSWHGTNLSCNQFLCWCENALSHICDGAEPTQRRCNSPTWALDCTVIEIPFLYIQHKMYWKNMKEIICTPLSWREYGLAGVFATHKCQG